MSQITSFCGVKLCWLCKIFDKYYHWLYWAVLGGIGLYWDLLGCIGRYWAVVSCTGLYLATLGYTGLYWGVLGCTVSGSVILLASLSL